MKPQEILAEICTACEKRFGEKITGIYVHGSLAFGCFHPANSDIDFLMVVSEALTAAEKEALIRLLLQLEEKAPQKGLEMSVLHQQVCKPFQYPTPFLLHYSKAHRAWAERDLQDYCLHMNGTDPDLAAHVTVTRKAGMVLCGRPIDEVFGEVPDSAYLASLRYDVENALEDIHHNPVYIILNLCRIAAWLQERKVLSKRDGGLWGMEHLPACYHGLISSALAAYEALQAYQPEKALESRFAAEMLERIMEEK